MTTAEVLIQLGNQSYIVRRSPGIPPGEIHVGSFQTLDALANLTQAPSVAAPVARLPLHGHEPMLNGKRVVLKLRASERLQARDWMAQYGQTLGEREREVMAAFYPASGEEVGSAAVGARLHMAAPTARAIRAAVLRRVGILQR